ncbi:H-NS histone family protein [Rhodoblastus acidophilus]|uniref:H-NS histone family protein n=1 Tax=Candidatus Rhodoblastus alkanivorans TaxID=2954117 RepID=A0ABS9Z9Q1_9HYPH|nr:H-NS histone family protein [Candidatus Rhodoblastus alkanivorans]MCI4677066.1 H-NS histone family protein [Candidatus Rhodoblastus alkanivorans]MCI4684419.1 H-NS histone family protein [Candidatus Rhodoblastus alkanivorans]MDI4641740.1 H-NS histone family protein [Rhodoblastus acidophilus]
MVGNKVDFNSMTVDELWSLHEEVSAILSARILEEKRELEKRLAILSRGADMVVNGTPPRFAPEAKPRRKYPKVVPQYRNPETFETWSGRGKRPRWVVLAMASGHDIEDFRIKDPGDLKFNPASPAPPDGSIERSA